MQRKLVPPPPIPYQSVAINIVSLTTLPRAGLSHTHTHTHTHIIVCVCVCVCVLVCCLFPSGAWGMCWTAKTVSSMLSLQNRSIYLNVLLHTAVFTSIYIITINSLQHIRRICILRVLFVGSRHGSKKYLFSFKSFCSA